MFSGFFAPLSHQSKYLWVVENKTLINTKLLKSKRLIQKLIDKAVDNYMIVSCIPTGKLLDF